MQISAAARAEKGNLDREQVKVGGNGWLLSFIYHFILFIFQKGNVPGF